MKTVGILGGGQLGMMLAEEVNKLGGKAICLDPNPKCSASFVCDSVIVSKYDDLEGLKKLGEASDVLTYEFENVPGEKLKFIRDTYNSHRVLSLCLILKIELEIKQMLRSMD